MCFSLVFVCLSVSQSRGWISGAVPCYASQTTLEAEPKEAWSPSSEEQAGRAVPLWLQSPLCVFGCVCACMYKGNLCESMYKGRGSHCHRGWAGALLEARPA